MAANGIFPALLSLVLGCSVPSSDTGPAQGTAPAEWAGKLEAWAGEGGVALLLDPVAPEGSALVFEDEDGEAVLVAEDPSTTVLDGDGLAGDCYELRAGGESLAEACAAEIVLAVALDPDLPVLLAGQDISLTLSPALEDSTLLAGDWLLRRSVPSLGQHSWLDPACLADAVLDEACWLDEALPVVHEPPFALPAYRPELDDDRVEDIGSYLRVTDDKGGVVFLGGEQRLAFVQADLFWGDVHAHSNLSMDGCEDIDAACGSRGELPGVDFFDNAFAIGLDFAALTDHAEYDRLSLPDGTTLELWDEAQALVQAAQALEEQGFLPLLGYEWTYGAYVHDPHLDLEASRDLFEAGHRTVLFRDTSACRDYRLASREGMESFVKLGTEMVYESDEEQHVAKGFGELLDALGRAAVTCGEQHWLGWFHHPAFLPPMPVSWASDEVQQHGRGDRLVEITSEHGSSECRDSSAEGCDFRVDPGDEGKLYASWGSVQEALTLGYRLGFLGGTDAHDGRPGSLTDGPSHTCPAEPPDDAKSPDEAQPNRLPSGGAVTGVWVRGDFARSSLWSALSQRRTLATTTRIQSAAMVASTLDGSLYLPGDELPFEAFPLSLQVAVEPGEDREVTSIELVDPQDGSVLHQADGAVLQASLAWPDTPAVYVRARLDWLGEEHRLWLSPLFVNEP